MAPLALPTPDALTTRRLTAYAAACAELERTAWHGGAAYEAALWAHGLAVSHLGEVSSSEGQEMEMAI